MSDFLQRTRILYGDNAVQKLQDSTVAVFGLGGVGGYVAEGLVRSGVGHLIFIDKDVIEPTNLNRQILATTDTLGAPKVEAAAQRAQSIHPGINITPYCLTYTDQLPPEVAWCRLRCDCIDRRKGKSQFDSRLPKPLHSHHLLHGHCSTDTSGAAGGHRPVQNLLRSISKGDAKGFAGSGSQKFNCRLFQRSAQTPHRSTPWQLGFRSRSSRTAYGVRNCPGLNKKYHFSLTQQTFLQQMPIKFYKKGMKLHSLPIL